MAEQRYTAAEVAAILCDGCAIGAPTITDDEGHVLHTVNGETVPCWSAGWRKVERRRRERLRMAAARSRRRKS
jgi:hypothetical protein